MFYSNYVALCNASGKSPSAVAEELGLSRATVTHWSDGSVPRQATLQKVAAYFGISVDALLAEGKKNTATIEGDGLSPLETELMQYVRELSEEQKRFLLAQMQMLKSQESHSDDPR